MQILSDEAVKSNQRPRREKVARVHSSFQLRDQRFPMGQNVDAVEQEHFRYTGTGSEGLSSRDGLLAIKPRTLLAAMDRSCPKSLSVIRSDINALFSSLAGSSR